MGCRFGVGGDHVHAGHDVGPVELLRRRETIAVDRDRVVQGTWREVRCERVRQAEDSRRAERRRSTSPGCRAGRVCPGRGWRAPRESGCDRRAARGTRRRRWGSALPPSGRVASARVVAWSLPGARPRPRSMRPGCRLVERAELFGDEQRRVVGQHDAAGAEADRRGVRGDVRDEHCRRRRCDGRDVVVLGVPDPPVAGLLRALGKRDAPGQAVGDRLALTDGREIEDREGNARHSGRDVMCASHQYLGIDLTVASRHS